MRTTVTLDADTEQIVRRRMAERQQSVTQALTEAIRDGASAQVGPTPFRMRTFSMGPSRVDLDQARHLSQISRTRNCFAA
ncbi:hypothetical protein [Agilicoccus flavus]|uniref:hypothetical protein n=1 Tax=Agilicoccus flavus TaxID=2775968 RepID=UPI001CF6C576|nr:hypothetical protein [Agilicoccus flavus]